MLDAERKAAEAALPAGYALVTNGQVIKGDLLWNFGHAKWEAVAVPQPMLPGQKRPGSRQHTEIGRDIAQFVAVARSRAD